MTQGIKSKPGVVELYPIRMQKKMFWLLFTVLGLVLDLSVPIYWGLALTLPLMVLCWWVAYRSGWFE